MNLLSTYVGTTLTEMNTVNKPKFKTLQKSSVYERICNHETSIALIGLGYVGLPIALEFAKDFKVIGFDINAKRVELMNKCVDPSGEITKSEFQNKQIQFSHEEESIKNSQVKIVAVPTPIDENKNPDLTPLISACRTIGRNLNHGDYIIFESTVYPGCTEEVCVPVLEEVSGLKFNLDFKVGYSPERINPGDRKNTLTSIKKIVSGSDEESAEQIYQIYNHIITAGIHLAPSMKVAEASKIVENTQRDVNIALMNELSTLFESLGINTHDVLEAAGTKWNFLNFYPGLVGGHCIGVDPYYLIHKGMNVNVDLPIIKSSRYVNDKMPSDVVSLAEKHLHNMGKSLNKSKVLILGSTFKENVTDLRNSKPAEMAQIFTTKALKVDIVDPLASNQEMRKYYGLSLNEKIENNYDAVIYAVNHNEFKTVDWDFVNQITTDKALVIDFKKSLGRNKSMEESIKYLTL